MVKRFHLLLAAFVLMTACINATAVYNVLGNRVGSITPSSEGAFVVKNEEGEILGAEKTGIIRDVKGRRMALAEDGVITDLRGVRLGAVTKQGDCIDPEGKRVGKIAGNVTMEGSGGACLLLLLLQE